MALGTKDVDDDEANLADDGGVSHRMRALLQSNEHASEIKLKVWWSVKLGLKL